MSKSVNTFNDGMNLNLADLVMQQTMSRLCMGMRIIDLDSSTFAITNIRGTEEKFQLTNHYIPLATAEYKNILYILSINPNTNEIELGSFQSPAYEGGTNYSLYRPFNNLNGGAFRTSVFGYNRDSNLKLILQPDYDESLNVVIVGKGHFPRIVNSKFKIQDGIPVVATARPGTANSNTYTTVSLDKETRLEVFSDKILKIGFGGIQTGGKIKPGNYVYVFYYMTEDFARTEMIGQSSLCQVSFGTSETSKRGGDSTEETTLKVVLNLTNVDTDFKYIKTFCLYSSGLDGVQQQYLEFVTPIQISGTTMTFTHTGFETLKEVSQDAVNTSFYGIDSANTGDQINGRLVLGGIQEKLVSLQALSAAAANMLPLWAVKELPPNSVPGYADPANVYNYMGAFGGESYPYAVVYILPGGALSPAFPVKGQIFTGTTGFVDVMTPSDQGNGIVTFWDTTWGPSYKDGKEQVKYIKLDVSSVPQEVKDISLGFFVVRGERRPWLLTQGLIIPTLRVPNIEYYTGGSGGAYYYDMFRAGTENTAYKAIPCIDQLLEALQLDEVGSSADPNTVVDDFFQISSGYMPIFVNDLKVAYATDWVDNFPTDRWAFISGDALINEPFYVTNLQREAPYIYQLGKVSFRVKGQISPLFDQRPFDAITPIPDYVVPSVGLHYDMESILRYVTPGYKKCASLSYVPAETMASASEFISQVGFRMQFHEGGSTRSYDVFQKYNSYFGIKMTDALMEGGKGSTSPQGGNGRMNNGGVYTQDAAHTSGVKYSNLGNLVYGGWIANIYSSNIKPTGVQLYPTTDDIVYRQVTPRYTWAEAATLGNQIDVFGGDAYICKVSRKLNQSGFRNPSVAEPMGPTRKANIDSGMVVTWWQESKYNLYLREPVQFDNSEIQKRSFFPFQSNGDFTKYRSYRYPESLKGPLGYGETSTIKSFISTPSLSPSIRNNFFSRLAASNEHVPNAFKNGYRIFLSTNFRDYDASMGEIVEIIAHRNKLVIIFEHGVGAINIGDRVLTGRDTAGPVFAEPSSVLPPNMEIWSNKIGAQDQQGVIKTPSAIYIMDQDKKKICRIVEGVESIVDEAVSSYLDQYSMTNPRCGYNLKYNEVIFTTDQWTLCFREGRNKFVAFYPYKSDFYATRSNEFYSFRIPMASTQGAFHVHDADTRLIFGEEQECFVEFVINESVATNKKFDVLELVSNEVRPSKIEWFTYDQESKRLLEIVPNGCQQYAHVVDGPNPFTDDNYIPYNNKRFVITIPKTEIYNGELDEWGIGGRMTNKLLICRITYKTGDPVKLMAALTTIRPTVS